MQGGMCNLYFNVSSFIFSSRSFLNLVHAWFLKIASLYVLAINTIDGGALVTKCVVSYCQEEQGNAVFAVHYMVKAV